MSRINFRKLFFVLGIVMFAGSLSAQHSDSLHHAQTSTEDHHATEENAFGSAEIIHHVSDDLGLHIIGDVSIPLPVIIYEPGVGLDIFSSAAFHHAHGLVRGKYYSHHGKLVIPNLTNGEMTHDEAGHVVGKHEARLTDLFTGNPNVFYNFSVTKNVFGIFLAMALLIFLFTSVAKKYVGREGEAPKGLQNAIEPLVMFVRDEVVKPAIGEKHYQRFLPYLLTVFFFIWMSNLLGLVPFLGGLNVTGNIAVTFTLAFMVMVVQVWNGNKNFWGHIFWFPGVPVPVKIILAVIEFIGLFTKPFSLMIRLFANITAGHIIIMSIIGITFAFSSSPALGFGVGLLTSLFSVAMFTLELLVAAIQAYIFTLLASLMLGAAVEEHHHHEDHGTSHAH